MKIALTKQLTQKALKFLTATSLFVAGALAPTFAFAQEEAPPTEEAEGAAEAEPEAVEPVKEKKKSLWKRSAGLGFTITQGNTDSMLGSANIRASRKHNKHELALGADATYGETGGAKQTEVYRGFTQYNYLFEERIYGGFKGDVMRDVVAEIDYRFTLAPLAGYYFIKNEKTTLAGEAGPAYIYEKQGTNAEGYVTLRLAERFEHNFNERVRLWQSLEYLPQVDDYTENFLIYSEIGVEASLTDKVSLRTYAQHFYDNQPAPGRKEGDLRWINALNMSF
jgi:putative salt-induced outer membrane protein